MFLQLICYLVTNLWLESTELDNQSLTWIELNLLCRAGDEIFSNLGRDFPNLNADIGGVLEVSVTPEGDWQSSYVFTGHHLLAFKLNSRPAHVESTKCEIKHIFLICPWNCVLLSKGHVSNYKITGLVVLGILCTVSLSLCENCIQCNK